MQRHSSIIYKQMMISMNIWKTIIQQRKVLRVFDDKIANMETNKKVFPIVTESCLKVPKTVMLNATHHCIVNIPDKREFQQLASNHLFYIVLKDFMKL